MLKVLVIGASGLVGGRLSRRLPREFDVYGTYHVKKPAGLEGGILRPLDITDKNQATGLFKEFKPDVVIHTAAVTNVDYCEDHREEAWRVNVEGTRNLVELSRVMVAKLVFMSTDYIFDGKNGPYSEGDESSPINYYGLTKLEGEKLVEKLDEHIIVRTTVVYGYDFESKNFAMQMLQKLGQNQKMNVPNDQYGNPTLADNLADAIAELILKDKNGVYNIVGADRVHRYDFALKIADAFNLNKGLITPVATEVLGQKARRPKNAGLKTDKAQAELDTELLSIGKALNIMKKQMNP